MKKMKTKKKEQEPNVAIVWSNGITGELKLIAKGCVSNADMKRIMSKRIHNDTVVLSEIVQ